MILFLFTSNEQQLLDAMLLEARGYTVKTVVDAHEVLKEVNHKPTARNLRWAVSHMILQCHFCVLHPEMDAVDVVASLEHARHLGAYTVHMDEVAFTPLLMSQEKLDAHDLCGDALRAPERLGNAVRNGLRALLARGTDGLRRMEERFNSYIGHGLKNPMVREQQARYSEPGQVSTTG